jgi:hypothetical protein
VCLGEWEQDEATGVIYWPDGSTYEGEMDKDGDRQGKGVYTDTLGNK